ncbi:MAG: MerR family transcriptional regulator [Frankiaceae bacterium]|jgi:DNA-binding transcriptional MerR regulator|nr:MerR family transcriptional regulator [Frankiaceae bacterium]
MTPAAAPASRAGAGRGESAGGSARLTIGEVLTALRGDFPDITISKIRFLEGEGLVTPERTAAGYRKFSAADVARLRFVLREQRDRYLPLRVIKEQLDNIDRGLAPGGTAALVALPAPAPDGAPSAEHFELGPAPLRLNREELANAAGLRPEQLRELEQYGLISARPDGHFDDDALAVARIGGQLASFGFEGRHLRTIRSAADNQVGLFAQIVDPLRRLRGAEGQARADEAVRELASLSVQLHAALIQRGLRDTAR